eukprot:scaffold41322_cov60-Phaeocystis_antarctica.AAC.4
MLPSGLGAGGSGGGQTAAEPASARAPPQPLLGTNAARAPLSGQADNHEQAGGLRAAGGRMRYLRARATLTMPRVPAQCQPRSHHREQRGVHHRDELEAHRSGGRQHVQKLDQVRRLVREGHLRQSRVRKACEECRLRPHGQAVGRVEVQLLLTNGEK